MGYGDSLMALGDAQDLYRRDPSLKVAVGEPESRTVVWDSLFDGVPELATQAEVDAGAPVQWVTSAPGNRPYIDYEAMAAYLADAGIQNVKRRKLPGMCGFYRWREDYRAKPAALRFSPQELELIHRLKREPPYIAVEPFLKRRAPRNKLWSPHRMGQVVDHFHGQGVRVVQLSSPEHTTTLLGASRPRTRSFREAICHVAAARLYIGNEGGLHHAAAAVGTQAVVMFGGYVPPHVTGYETHVNLTGGARYWCGTKAQRCEHCVEAMANITVAEVIAAAEKELDTIRVG